MSEIWRARIGAEFLGTAFLLAAVVGSGLMAERLAGGNMALALLGNTLPTGAILFVLIVIIGPLSGAHFNPAVTLVLGLERALPPRLAGLYVLAQIAGAVAGVLLAHMMFAHPVLEWGIKPRSGAGQWLGEAVASFGLVLVIRMAEGRRLETIAGAVGLYITAAYWFTSSTSFANPAVTLARSLSNSFSGIRPLDAPLFIVFQLLGAVLAMWVARLLKAGRPDLGAGPD